MTGTKWKRECKILKWRSIFTQYRLNYEAMNQKERAKRGQFQQDSSNPILRCSNTRQTWQSLASPSVETLFWSDILAHSQMPSLLGWVVPKLGEDLCWGRIHLRGIFMRSNILDGTHTKRDSSICVISAGYSNCARRCRLKHATEERWPVRRCGSYIQRGKGFAEAPTPPHSHVEEALPWNTQADPTLGYTAEASHHVQ